MKTNVVCGIPHYGGSDMVVYLIVSMVDLQWKVCSLHPFVIAKSGVGE